MDTKTIGLIALIVGLLLTFGSVDILQGKDSVKSAFSSWGSVAGPFFKEPLTWGLIVTFAGIGVLRAKK